MFTMMEGPGSAPEKNCGEEYGSSMMTGDRQWKTGLSDSPSMPISFRIHRYFYLTTYHCSVIYHNYTARLLCTLYIASFHPKISPVHFVRLAAMLDNYPTNDKNWLHCCTSRGYWGKSSIISLWWYQWLVDIHFIAVCLRIHVYR